MSRFKRIVSYLESHIKKTLKFPDSEVTLHNRKTRKCLVYKLYHVASRLELHDKGKNGDLAIVSPHNGPKKILFNENGTWNLAESNRVGCGKRLTHFPDNEWSRYVLHGDFRSLEWAHEDALRRRRLQNAPRAREDSLPFDGVNHNLTSFTPTPTPPAQSSNSSNTYLLISEAISHFQQTFAKSPETIQKCIKPLQLLLDKAATDTIRIIPVGNAKADGLLPDQNIMMADLVQDLICSDAEGVDIDIQDCFQVSSGRTQDLLTAMCTDGKGIEDEYTPVILGAVNVPAHQLGSKGVMITLHNTRLRDSGTSSIVQKGFIDSTSVLSCTGYVTEPHYDYFGIPQIIIHGGGHKVWLIWPPTSENLKEVTPIFTSKSKSIAFSISEALEKLSGLEIRECRNRGDWFLLDPCSIHAVISISSSAHKNKLYVDYGSFDKWDEAYSMIVKALDAEEQKQRTDKKARENIIKELDDSTQSFFHWETLLKEKPNHPLAATTRARLEQIKCSTRDVLKRKHVPQQEHEREQEFPRPEVKKSRKRAINDLANETRRRKSAKDTPQKETRPHRATRNLRSQA